MLEVIENWPWFDRLILGALAATVGFAPWIIAMHLERIQRQNERIIHLLLDIKIGRREVP
jgi:hypothetical protein